MRKGDTIRGKIEYVKFPNKGIFHTEDGKICEVKNAAPGQTVEARISKKRNGRIEANLLAVVERAPDEIDPPCPHFGICGGCTWLQMTYEKELALKESQVRSLLEKSLQEAYHLSGAAS